MTTITLSEADEQRLREAATTGPPLGTSEQDKRILAALPAPAPTTTIPVGPLTLKARADGTAADVVQAPAGTKLLHCAWSTASSGGTTVYTNPEAHVSGDIAIGQPIPAQKGYAYVSAEPRDGIGTSLGAWSGRVKVEPAPAPEPAPTPSGLVTALDISSWGGPMVTGAISKGIKRFRVNTTANIAAIKAAGGRVVTVAFHAFTWGDSEGPLKFQPATYERELLEAMKAHPEVLAWEVLNEPEGTPNPTEAAKIKRYVELLKAARNAANQIPAEQRPRIIASWAPTYSFGKAWAAAGGLQYVDGVVVHAYGGTSGQHGGLTGARDLILQARQESGKPVYVTEVGWPTGLSQGVTTATGDSQQWTYAQQADAITNFANWCREPGQSYVAMFVYFNGVDYGSNMLYGVKHAGEPWTDKPGATALAAAMVAG